VLLQSQPGQAYGLLGALWGDTTAHCFGTHARTQCKTHSQVSTQPATACPVRGHLAFAVPHTSSCHVAVGATQDSAQLNPTHLAQVAVLQQQQQLYLPAEPVQLPCRAESATSTKNTDPSAHTKRLPVSMSRDFIHLFAGSRPLHIGCPLPEPRSTLLFEHTLPR
jgi:hypothetical protein